jgi:hypothetical protein
VVDIALASVETVAVVPLDRSKAVFFRRERLQVLPDLGHLPRWHTTTTTPTAQQTRHSRVKLTKPY